MTMETMVKHLESVGFETTKRYDSVQGGYFFRISKDDFHAEKFFRYPADVSAGERDKKQREFIGSIINLWHRNYTEFKRCKVGEDIDEHNDKLNSLYSWLPYPVNGYVDTNDHAREMVVMDIREMYPTTILKGENNMNTIINDIAQGKDAYIVTESGKVPVKIDDLDILFDEPTRFHGRMLTPSEAYVRTDISNVAKLAATMREIDDRLHNRIKRSTKLPGIKTVHFSGPCTVVIWEDKTKTVVRCKDGEEPDYEKGLAMAIAKKALGTNKSGSNYYDIFKKWLPKPEGNTEEVTE